MLTKKQKNILDFIKNYTKRKGYSPILQEIAKHFKLASVATVHQHVNALKQKGYLNKTENQRRSINVFQKEKFVSVPLIGTITAGEQIEMFQQSGESIAIPKIKIKPNQDYFTLKVTGESMIEKNIDNGDIVLVKQQNIANNGDHVVALIDNSETTLKTFYKEKNQIRLQPANKSLNPIIIDKNRDFLIQGIIVDVIKNSEKETKNRKSQREEIKKYDSLPINQIICGDAVEVMQAMPPNSVDLVVTSPPYDELRNYNGYVFNFLGMAKGLFRVIKKGGVLIWVVGDKINKGNKSLTSFKQALSFQNLGFNVHDVMIYKKRNTPFMRSNAYTNCYEFMFVFSKDSPKTFNPLKTKTVRQGHEMLPFNKKADGINKKIRGELKPEKTLINVWEYAVGLHGSTSDRIAFQHTAIFPEKLAEDHIKTWTKTGDVVFDPMCGSGTTCKMAAINKRYYIGCDISKEYVELTKKRLKCFNL
ncbi:MAG: transcriptional repressor LexA [bacterium]